MGYRAGGRKRTPLGTCPRYLCCGRNWPRSIGEVQMFSWAGVVLSPFFHGMLVLRRKGGAQHVGREKKGPALTNETPGHLEKSNLIECRCGASGRRKFGPNRDIFVPFRVSGDQFAASATRRLAEATAPSTGYECDGATMTHGIRPGHAPAPVSWLAPRPSAPDGSGARGSASQASMSRHTVSPCRSRVSMW